MADRFPLTALAGALLPLIASVSAIAATDAELEAKAQELNRKQLNVDAHTDVLIPSTPERYWAPGHTSRTDVQKLTKGGIDVLALSIAVGPGPRTPAGLAEAQEEAKIRQQTIQDFVKANSSRVEIALNAADVERIYKQGKIAVIQTFLNARSLGKNVDGIDAYYKAGVRVFGLTHAGNNDFADSSRPQAGEGEEHKGLSPLGKQAIAKINSLGALVDISQLTPAGVSQVLAITKAPVIATHSDVRSLVDNTRNLSDQELDAIKKNGGVVSAVPFNSYLAKAPQGIGPKVTTLRKQFGLAPEFTGTGFNAGYDTLPADKQTEFLNAINALIPKATVKDYVDHIDYLVKRIGVDHVGIGTDFNHGSGITGFNDESEAPNVTKELLRRGYTDEQIAKIWGGNFLRVFREAERAGKQARPT